MDESQTLSYEGTAQWDDREEWSCLSSGDGLLFLHRVCVADDGTFRHETCTVDPVQLYSS